MIIMWCCSKGPAEDAVHQEMPVEVFDSWALGFKSQVHALLGRHAFWLGLHHWLWQTVLLCWSSPQGQPEEKVLQEVSIEGLPDPKESSSMCNLDT